MRAGRSDGLSRAHRRPHPLEFVGVDFALQHGEFFGLLMLGVVEHRVAQLGELVDELVVR